MDCLDTLETLVANVSKAPTELKFRKLRLSNPKVAAAVAGTPGALAALQHMGWQVEGGCDIFPRSLTNTECSKQCAPVTSATIIIVVNDVSIVQGSSTRI